jgi:hypothetical protein
LAVLDLNLPKIGGIEVLEATAFANVPVAVLSSSSSAREGKGAGIRRRTVHDEAPDLEEFMEIRRILRNS